MAASGSTTVVLFALGANFCIAVAKFAGSVWTGSSAMLSEAIHSLVDTCNQGLILYGIKRSQRRADARHPFGYSKELYFWSFVVAILLFSLGAGVAIYEGVVKVLHPHPITHPHINYIILGFALVVEGIAWWKASQEFNKRRGDANVVPALKASKDPALFAVLLEDTAAIIGLLAALAGLLAVQYLNFPQGDGIASIAIGLVLAATAAFMSIEIKALIIGEAADEAVQDGLFEIICAKSADTGPILAVNEIRTMHLGPDDILVAASVDFRDGITSQVVEATTGEIERAIKQRFPRVRRLFLEAQSMRDHGEALAAERDHKDNVDAPPQSKAQKAVLVKDKAASYPPSRKARKKARRKKR